MHELTRRGVAANRRGSLENDVIFCCQTQRRFMVSEHRFLGRQQPDGIVQGTGQQPVSPPKQWRLIQLLLLYYVSMYLSTCACPYSCARACACACASNSACFLCMRAAQACKCTHLCTMAMASGIWAYYSTNINNYATITNTNTTRNTFHYSHT